MNFESKPLSLTCHLCSREFGLSSLGVHIPQCEKKWTAGRNVLPPSLITTDVPLRPTQSIPTKKNRELIDKYNEEANEIFRSESLVQCPGCTRRFNPDALNVHLKSCAVGASAVQNMPTKKRRSASSLSKSMDASSSTGGSSQLREPKHFVCYVCGMKLGTTSLAIHIPQCIQKFEKMQESSPIPKKVPDPPKSSIPSPNSSTFEQELQVYNEEATTISQDLSRSACTYCGRKFNPDRIAKHMDSCASKPKGVSAPKASNPLSKSMNSLGGGIGGGGGSSTGGSMNSTMSGTSKPLALSCHLCGRDFGTSSLEIHITQCLVKRQASQKELPQELRKKTPHPPKLPIPGKGPNYLERVTAYNQEAYKIYEENSRSECTNCGRKFNPEALLVHLKSCGGGTKSPAATTKLPGERPRLLMCCICGREFGSMSLGIHQKTCMKVHGWSEADLKKRQARDQPVKGMNSKQLDEFNNAAYESYSTHTLVPCDVCGRTFLPDRLPIHKKSCKPGSSSKPITRARTPSSTSLSQSMDQSASAPSPQSSVRKSLDPSTLSNRPASSSESKEQSSSTGVSKRVFNINNS
jgi:Zn finger protein HypA/HybF involved in hydrogenase expression